MSRSSSAVNPMKLVVPVKSDKFTKSPPLPNITSNEPAKSSTNLCSPSIIPADPNI